MPNDHLCNRTVGSKVTESEYAQLAAIAEREGEWCRDVLLARVHACQAIAVTAADRALLAEIVALRAILLNALYKLAPQEDLTDQDAATGCWTPSRWSNSPVVRSGKQWKTSRGACMKSCTGTNGSEEIAKKYAKQPEGTSVVSPDNQSRMEINQVIHREMQAMGQVKPPGRETESPCGPAGDHWRRPAMGRAIPPGRYRSLHERPQNARHQSWGVCAQSSESTPRRI